MFLNVIPAFSPLPAVHGLGNARMIPIPPRGFGQTTQGCPELQFDGYMQSWLSSLQAEPPSDAAVGCGANGGEPCTSPDEASSMAMLIAENYCSVVADGAAFGCPSDPACNNLSSAVGPYTDKALAFFRTFDPSVWATEAANLKSGMIYGSSHSSCPAGTFPSIANGVLSCSGPSGQGPTPTASQGSSPYIAPVDTSVSRITSSGDGGPTTNQPMGSPVVQTTTPAPLVVAAPDPFAFLTQSVIGGIPNWGLIVAGVAALFLLGSKR